MKLLVPPSFSAAAVATSRAVGQGPVPPGGERPARLVRRAMSAYARRFAGRARGRCDATHLRALVSALEEARQGFTDLEGADRLVLSARIAEVDDHLGLLTLEARQVALAATPEAAAERAGVLAGLLNDRVAEWRDLVEGGSRLARREGLLRRLAESVGLVAELFADPALDGAPWIDENRAYAEAVRERMEGELDLLVYEQAQAHAEARLQALGMELAALIERWRVEVGGATGPAREVVTLLCEQMAEVEVQAEALLDRGGEGARVLLGAARANLDAWETTWEELATAPPRPPGG